MTDNKELMISESRELDLVDSNLTKVSQKNPLSVDDVLHQVEKVQDLMRRAMKEGIDYGKIPGTDSKPSLLKPGAEQLCFLFHLLPKYEVERIDLGNGHLQYEIICGLYHEETGKWQGDGVGNCSTMESKYRWRADWEDTGEAIPVDAKAKKTEYRAQGYGMRKEGGNWLWVRYTAQRVENVDIADTWNTVKKIAKKRAYLDATLSRTAASHVFTQDVGDDDTASHEAPHEKPAASWGGKPKPADKPKVDPEINYAKSLKAIQDAKGDALKLDVLQKQFLRGYDGKQLTRARYEELRIRIHIEKEEYDLAEKHHQNAEKEKHIDKETIQNLGNLLDAQRSGIEKM